MSAELSDLRPPVIKRLTRHCLDEYRGFRHVVRNVYTFNLRPSRLHELATTLPSCFEAVCDDFTAFVDFLKQIDIPEK